MTWAAGTRTSANVNTAWWLPSSVPNRLSSVTPGRLVSMSTIAGPIASTSTSALMKSASAPPVTYDFCPLTTSSSPSRTAQVCRGASAGSVKPKPLRISPARYGSRNCERSGSSTLASTPGEGPKIPWKWPTLRLPSVSRTMVSASEPASLPPSALGWVMPNTPAALDACRTAAARSPGAAWSVSDASSLARRSALRSTPVCSESRKSGIAGGRYDVWVRTQSVMMSAASARAPDGSVR